MGGEGDAASTDDEARADFLGKLMELVVLAQAASAPMTYQLLRMALLNEALAVTHSKLDD